MDIISLLGLTAAALTTSSFIPQIIRTWKYRNTKAISLGMYIVFSSGVILWLLYGIIKSDIAIIFANAISILFVAVIIGFKLKYK